MVLVPNVCSTPNVVYLSKEVSGQFELFKYTTADNGASWTPEAITAASTNKQIRPISPKNAPVGKSPIWMNGVYTTFEDYLTDVKTIPIPTRTHILGGVTVKIPILSSTVDSSIFLYYGKSGITAPAGTTPWSTDYEFSCKMTDENIRANILDSSKNAFAGHKNTIGSTEISGAVFNGQRFGGGHVEFPALNMAGWDKLIAGVVFKYDKQSSTASYAVFSNYSSTAAAFMIRIATSTNKVQGYVIVEGNLAKGGLFNDIVMADEEIAVIHLEYDASTGLLKMYKNGVLSTTIFASTAVMAEAASPVLLVGGTPHTPAGVFMGDIFDAVIIKGARPAGWFAVDALNKLTPVSLYSVGAEVDN